MNPFYRMSFWENNDVVSCQQLTLCKQMCFVPLCLNRCSGSWGRSEALSSRAKKPQDPLVHHTAAACRRSESLLSITGSTDKSEGHLILSLKRKIFVNFLYGQKVPERCWIPELKSLTNVWKIYSNHSFMGHLCDLCGRGQSQAKTDCYSRTTSIPYPFILETDT